MDKIAYKLQVDTFIATASFEKALEVSESLNNTWSASGKELRALIDKYPRGPMNLTPDHVKALPEYQTLYASCETDRVKAQIFNAAFTKKFKKEYRAHIQAQREAKLKASVGA